jgi:hypothetical protein
MGLTQDFFADDDLTLIRQALDSDQEKMRGVTFEALMERGWVRLNLPTPYAPFAHRQVPDAEREV